MIIRLTSILLFVFLLAFSLQAFAEGQGNWQRSGSLRSLNLSSDSYPGDLSPSFRLSSTYLRLESVWNSGSHWQVETVGDYQLLGTDPDGIVPLPKSGVNRHFDLDHSWNHQSGWDSRLQIDRINATWTGEKVDLAIGRQAVGFGRIAIFSPLDIIAPFSPDALDTDYRPGVDAMRLTTYYGLDGQLGAVAVLGDVDRHNSYLVTWVDNRAGIDLLAIGGSLRKRPMMGFGGAGNLGSLGIKAEMALYEGERVDQPGGDLHEHMVMSAVECWYRFDSGITLITEYLHNGAGESDPAKYTQVLFSAPYEEGLTSLLGRHYLLMTTNYELHPLASLNGLFLWNLQDDSWLLRPTLDVSLADNVSLELFWTYPDGDSPEQHNFFTEARSEFGSQGQSGGLFLKWFF